MWITLRDAPMRTPLIILAALGLPSTALAGPAKDIDPWPAADAWLALNGKVINVKQLRG